MSCKLSLFFRRSNIVSQTCNQTMLIHCQMEGSFSSCVCSGYLINGSNGFLLYWGGVLYRTFSAKFKIFCFILGAKWKMKAVSEKSSCLAVRTALTHPAPPHAHPRPTFSSHGADSAHVTSLLGGCFHLTMHTAPAMGHTLCQPSGIPAEPSIPACGS